MYFVGLGDPHYFYVEMAFLLNGIKMSVFFLFGTYLRYLLLYYYYIEAKQKPRQFVAKMYTPLA